MRKVLFIVGPTATGKTDLALSLASKFNGELVNADSVQVFKGLDIISGKDLPKGYKFRKGFYSHPNEPSIHLLDIVDPTLPFNVSSFFKYATDTIDSIFKKGKHPIVVGGTGLYIEVLLNGLDESIEPNQKLREKLDSLSILELQKFIPQSKLDTLNVSDKNNKRRLIRQIEKLKIKKQKEKSFKTNYDSLVIGLECNRDILREKIEKRVSKRLENGALIEAKRLFTNYSNLTQQVKDANGYRQLFQFLSKETSLDEAVEKWKISEYHHAKNQMTWFRKYGGVEWYDIEKANFGKKIEKRMLEFLL